MNPDHNEAPAQRTAAATDELHVCVLCAGRLVYPFDWVAEGPRHWLVLLRCPECQGIREGIFTQAAADALADAMDRGSSILIRALEELTRENMTREIDVLVRALEDDLIVPSDF